MNSIFLSFDSLYSLLFCNHRPEQDFRAAIRQAITGWLQNAVHFTIYKLMQANLHILYVHGCNWTFILYFCGKTSDKVKKERKKG